jgi:ribonuclease BN (tRNA processing enzyme)
MNEFKLTILGSGTMMPTVARHPSSYLLEIGGKKNFDGLRAWNDLKTN